MLNRIIWIAVSFSIISLIMCWSTEATGFIPRLSLQQSTPKANPYAIALHASDEVEKASRTAGKAIPKVTDKDTACLQKNIYFEARNQNLLGQLMVAMVTIERKNAPEFPKTVCDVVFQRKQFSWANKDKARQPKLNNAAEAEAWKRAGMLADLSLRYLDVDSPMTNVKYYHANYVNPKWAKKMEIVAKVDDHIFYRDKGH